MKSEIIDFEVTTACNASCIMCPRSITRAQGVMEPKLFYDIAGNLLDCSPEIINFCGYGEPLLNNHIAEYIAFFSKRGIKTTLRTNGSKLTQDRIKQLLDSGLDIINLSVQGISRSTYERIMRGLSFITIMRAVESVLKHGSTYSIDQRVNAVRLRENIHELEQMASFWNKHGIEEFESNPCHSRGGELKNHVYEESQNNSGSCDIFDRVTYVAWSGDVLSCCQDVLHHKIEIGDMSKENCRVILENKSDVKNTAEFIGLCNKCDKLVNYDWIAISK